MKTLKILVVSSEQQYRDTISAVMEMVGHKVFGSRTAKQAEGFVLENGRLLDAIIVDFDTVKVDMEQLQGVAPQACLIIQSTAYRDLEMPHVAVGTALISKRVETARIEQYLQQLVPLRGLAEAA